MSPSRLPRIATLLGLIPLLLTPLLPACASGSGGSGSGRSSTLITTEEIRNSLANNGYELVQQLRPAWLRGRGATSIRHPTPELPQVYVDGVRLGPTGSLYQLNVDNLMELRYINAADATTRYGTGHTGGVIEVRTTR